MLPRPGFQLDWRPAEQRRNRVGRHRAVGHVSIKGLPRPFEHARGIVRLNVARHDHLARSDAKRQVVRVMTRAWIGRSVALLSTPAGIVTSTVFTGQYLPAGKGRFQ
jgi:hypothetical protein